MKDAELKYRILQHLVDEPMDEYQITTLGAAIGAEARCILAAIAELVRDGYLKQLAPGPAGEFRLCLRRRPAATTELRSQRTGGEAKS